MPQLAPAPAASCRALPASVSLMEDCLLGMPFTGIKVTLRGGDGADLESEPARWVPLGHRPTTAPVCHERR